MENPLRSWPGFGEIWARFYDQCVLTVDTNMYSLMPYRASIIIERYLPQ
jgi:hypothetical protein